MRVVITAPSLDPMTNVSGISSLTRLIIDCNKFNSYTHIEVGRKDNEIRNAWWLIRIIGLYIKWTRMLLGSRDTFIHFNLALNTPSIVRDSPMIVASRLCGKRMIIHLHGGEVLTRARLPLWLKCLLQLTLSGRNPKIVLSSQEKELLNRRLTAGNVVVLPNCISLESAKTFQRTHPTNEGLVILFMGRICRHKGLEFVFDALKDMQDRGKRFTFVMAGRGPDETSYIPRFRELLGPQFQFKGVVTGDHQRDLLKQCNIFLLPSLFEGLPMALLESMSYGVVPVTTNVGSIGTVVRDGNNGLIIPKRSTEGIVAALERLGKDRALLESLSQNARHCMFDNFGADLYIQKLNDLYQYE